VALSLVRQQSLTPHSNRNRYKLILKTKKIGDGTQNGEALDAYDLKIAMDLHDDLQDALQTKKSN
jgi:hypothetical protein